MEIARIVLLDSAHIQEEDAEFKRLRHLRENRKGPYPELPLYTEQDVERTLELLSPVSYKSQIKLPDGLTVSFHDAGHILGSSMLKVTAVRDKEHRTILFSGDIGRWDKPILNDPTVFERADYLCMESTYGDRLHDSSADLEEKLGAVIRETWKAGGNIVIPSFAIGRTQEVLYHLNSPTASVYGCHSSAKALYGGSGCPALSRGRNPAVHRLRPE